MTLLAIFTLISATLVLISRNIVYALAFLVTTFFLSAVLLINIGLEFLGYVLIVVYVGAIAILFLFVVMTLDITNEELASSQVRNSRGYTSHMVASAFFFFVLWSIYSTAAPIDALFEKFSFIQDPWVPVLHSGGAGAVAQTLYTHNFLYLFLAGLLLLVAMVGAVLLALPPVRLSQDSYKQAHRQPAKAVKRS